MKYTIAIFFSFSIISGYTQNTQNEKDADRKLFQLKGNGNRYIILSTDTAYYERKQADKVPYFTDQDTFIRSNNSSVFYGKKGTMRFENKALALTLKPTKNSSERKLMLLPADEKQVSAWNVAHNRDLYFRTNATVNAVLLKRSSDPTYYRRLEDDWRAISKDIVLLNHQEFDEVVCSFKKKYAMK
jgi:hypothetical protein